MSRNFRDLKGNSIIAKASQKSLEEANKTPSKNIPLDMIDEGELNEYIFRRKEEGDIETLKDIIVKNGFDDPLGVYQKDDGRYEIYSGHRRFLAVKELGWTTVPAVIRPYDKDKLALIRRLGASNLGSLDVTPMQMARLVSETAKIIEENGIKGNKAELVAETLGCGLTRSSVIKYMTLLHFIPALQDKDDAGIVPYSALYHVHSKFRPTVEEQETLNKQLDIRLNMPEEEEEKQSFTRKEVIIKAEQIHEATLLTKRMTEESGADAVAEEESSSIPTTHMPGAMQADGKVKEREIKTDKSDIQKASSRGRAVKSIVDTSLTLISLLSDIPESINTADRLKLSAALHKVTDAINEKREYLEEK